MNSPEKWKTTYESLMQARGFHVQDEDAENRRHSRLGFKSGTTVSVQMAPVSCQIINISVGGIFFYSDIPLPSGHSVTINLDNSLSLHLRVDSCHVEEVEPVLMVTSHRYTVGAKFVDQHDGYRVMSEVLKSHGDSLFELTV